MHTHLKSLKSYAIALAAVFAAGSSFAIWQHSLATKSDVDAKLAPLIKEEVAHEKRLKTLEQDLVPAVQKIVARFGAEDKLADDIRLLELMDREHNAALQEYAAKKAARQRADYPKKSAEHLRLEAKVFGKRTRP